MKDLKTIDLCARLPYTPTVQWKRIEDNSIMESKFIILDASWLLNVGCKPILFSLDCLTKPITVNGRTFVPIEEMDFGTINPKTIVLLFEAHEYNSLPNSCIEFCLKNHINYRLPEGEYIPVTNEFNPYG